MGNIVKASTKVTPAFEKDGDQSSLDVWNIASENSNHNNVVAKRENGKIDVVANKKSDLNLGNEPPESEKQECDTQSYFLTNLEDVIAAEGSTIVLECSIKISSFGKISWYKNNCLLEDESKDYSVENDQNGCNRLIIPEARYELLLLSVIM